MLNGAEFMQTALGQAIGQVGKIGQIGMNRVLFVSAVSQMKKAANNFTVTAEKWTDLGENSKVFDVYLGGYVQLHKIFEKYQQLALKDIDAIDAIRNELEEMDNTLTSAWQ